MSDTQNEPHSSTRLGFSTVATMATAAHRLQSQPSSSNYLSSYTPHSTHGTPSNTASTEHKSTNKATGSDAWELYLNSAEEFDAELKKRLDEDLEVILIVAALLGGLLAQFCASTVGMLSKSGEDKTVELLMAISQQMRNFTLPAASESTIESFSVEPGAMRVNFLFFTSLALSVVTVFLAMGAKRWVREYAHGISRITSPEYQACHRHYRYEGLMTWKLPEFVNLLYSIIHLCLLLFFAGISDFLFNVNQAVASTSIIIYVICVLVYCLTTLFAAMYSDCPYKSPLSRTISRFFGNSWVLLMRKSVIHAFTASPVWGASLIKPDLTESSSERPAHILYATYVNKKLSEATSTLRIILLNRFGGSSSRKAITAEMTRQSEHAVVARRGPELKFKSLEWLLDNVTFGHDWSNLFWRILKEAITTTDPYHVQHSYNPCWQQAIEKLASQLLASHHRDFEKVTTLAEALLVLTPARSSNINIQETPQIHQLISYFTTSSDTIYSLWGHNLRLRFCLPNEVETCIEGICETLRDVSKSKGSKEIIDRLHVITIRSLWDWRRCMDRKRLSQDCDDLRLVQEVLSALADYVEGHSEVKRLSVTAYLQGEQCKTPYPIHRLQTELELALGLVTGSIRRTPVLSGHSQIFGNIELLSSALIAFAKSNQKSDGPIEDTLNQAIYKLLVVATWNLLDRFPYLEFSTTVSFLRCLSTNLAACLPLKGTNRTTQHENTLVLLAWLWNEHPERQQLMTTRDTATSIINTLSATSQALYNLIRDDYSHPPTVFPSSADAFKILQRLGGSLDNLLSVEFDQNAQIKDILIELLVPNGSSTLLPGLSTKSLLLTDLLKSFRDVPQSEKDSLLDSIASPILKYMWSVGLRSLNREYFLEMTDVFDLQTCWQGLHDGIRTMIADKDADCSVSSPEFKITLAFLGHSDQIWRIKGSELYRLIFYKSLRATTRQSALIDAEAREIEAFTRCFCQPVVPLLKTFISKEPGGWDDALELFRHVVSYGNDAALTAFNNHGYLYWLDSHVKGGDPCHIPPISGFLAELFLKHGYQPKTPTQLHTRATIIIDFLEHSDIFQLVQKIPELMAQWLEMQVIHRSTERADEYCGDELINYIHTSFAIDLKQPRFSSQYWSTQSAERVLRRQILDPVGMRWDETNNTSWSANIKRIKWKWDMMAMQKVTTPP